jgi:hypothetical protein
MPEITLEQFRQSVSSIQFHLLSNVKLNRDTRDPIADDSGDEGAILYTEGLSSLLGFELISYGAGSPEDLVATATLHFVEADGAMLIDIPHSILTNISPEFSEHIVYKQGVINEQVLEGLVGENPIDVPTWTPDGNIPLIPNTEFNAILDTLKQPVDNELPIKQDIEAVRQRYRDLIEQHGHAVVGVFDDTGQRTNFAYTVGLTKQQLPEIIVSGRFELEDLHQFLSHFLDRLQTHGFAFHAQKDAFSIARDLEGKSQGDLYDIRMVEIDPAPAVERYLIQAPAILRQPVPRVMQLQISDKSKRYPGDSDFVNEFEQDDVAPVIAS